MFQRYIITMPLYLLLIAKCHTNASQHQKSVRSLESFLNKFVKMVQEEMHERLNTSMYHLQMPDHLDSVSGRRIQLGKDRLARIFGLSFKFGRNGNCERYIKNGKNTLRCPVKFDDLLIQLPLLDNEETVYVAHVTVKGALDFRQDRNGTTFHQFILLNQQYEMRNSNGKPVNPPPAAYCLKAKSPSGLKAVLQKRLQDLIVKGEFKDAVLSSLKRMRKAKDMSGSKTSITFI
uniref:Putative secreted protein n=1 Tax=Ixodes ricinus TaxID=34613 RepID=A0A6B0V4W1_IXORI